MTSTIVETQSIRCLTYNVSHQALLGTRYGVYIICDPTNQSRRITLSSKYGDRPEQCPNLPGSKLFQSNLPYQNILRYLIDIHANYDLIHLVEANQKLIQDLKTRIHSDYQIIRFWGRGMSESCYLIHNKRFQPVDAFCIGFGTRKDTDLEQQCPKCQTPFQETREVNGYGLGNITTIITKRVCPNPDCKYDALAVPEPGTESTVDGVRLRGAGVVVFPGFIFVGVHLPHAMKHQSTEIENINKLLISTLNYLLSPHFHTDMNIKSIIDLPIIIGGDFNHETPFNIRDWLNTSPRIKTAFLLVSHYYHTKYREQPLQYAYDRFVCSRKVKPYGFIGTPLEHLERYPLSTGEMSDHLPCEFNFLINPDIHQLVDTITPIFDRNTNQTRLIEYGNYVVRIYPRNVGVPHLVDEDIDVPKYRPLFPSWIN